MTWLIWGLLAVVLTCAAVVIRDEACDVRDNDDGSGP